MTKVYQIKFPDFPTTCVDRFFKDPERIRQIAMSADYGKPPGNYPGIRTSELHEIDQELFNEFCSKLFSIFIDYNLSNASWEVDARFQKIYPYSDDKNSFLNMGWYHLDDGVAAAGVVYLTPDANPDSGTTIGTPNGKPYDDSLYDARNKFYLNRKPSTKHIEKCRDEVYYHESECPDDYVYQSLLLGHDYAFDKTIEFKNVYNRMIFYDSSYFHKESNFYAHPHEPRLTLVFFVRKIESKTKPPIQRSNSHSI